MAKPKGKKNHGLSKTREHNSWSMMRSRCNNPNNEHYPNYGGRGIYICARWDDFLLFLADMGARPESTSIDRIDNEKGYSPENCRWSTCEEQCSNTRRNRHLTINGITKTVTQWSEYSGIGRTTIDKRTELGWSAARAVFAPVLIKYRQRP